ncbi:MAG: hypothetical protein H6561_08905 [Lewinellaceae bacterium]|nr:hypothetical protein [Lewinellaceae bacterium]
MPNPVSLEFQEYSSGPSGANRDHLRNQFGTRSYRCQIRLAWNFRNYSRGPSGANRDHLRNQFGTRSHRCQIRLAWNFRHIPGGHREQTVITSEINSEPGPIDAKSG